MPIILPFWSAPVFIAALILIFIVGAWLITKPR